MTLKKYAEERDKVFTAAVMNDDWDAVRKFCRKYGMSIPKNSKVLKGGVYKAVQQCINIPEDVKVEAVKKCLEIGMSPFIDWGADDDSEGGLIADD